MPRPRLVRPVCMSRNPLRMVGRALVAALAFFVTISATAQFELQDSGTVASLRGVSSPGNGVAWASGTGGTVLRTEDGGFVWQGCAMPPGAEKLDFRGVQAFDGQTALVMSSGKGDLSRVYKTTDGCRTWKLVFTDPDADGFFDAIAMNPHSPSLRDYGVLAGDQVNGAFALFITVNKGDTWERLKGLPAAHKGEVLFAASNQSLAWLGWPGSFALVTGGDTESSRILFFDNCFDDSLACEKRYPSNGRNKLFFDESEAGWTRGWSAHRLNLPKGASAGAFALAPTTIGISAPFVVVGGDYAKPDTGLHSAVVYKAEHDASFIPMNPWHTSKRPPHGYRSSVAYDAASKTWITVGPNGTDVSRDDGRNWVALRPGAGDAADADRQWNALALPFVVGPHGRIGRLREGVLPPTPR